MKIKSQIVLTLLGVLAAHGQNLSSYDTRIPFELVNDHVYVQVRVNGSRPLSFIVDTGAGTVISQAIAKDLGLRTAGKGTVFGSGETAVEHQFVPRVDLSVGGQSFIAKKVAVLPLSELQGVENRAIDGLLGESFFENFVVTIDYKAGILQLHSPKRFRYQGTGESIRLKRAGGTIFVRAMVRPEGKPDLKGLFEVDTGGAHALLINSPVVEANTLISAEQKKHVVRAVGFGVANVVVGSVQSLQIGSFRVEKPVTLFSLAKNGFFATNAFIGTIGGEVLKQKKVTFDYARKVMILEDYPSPSSH